MHSDKLKNIITYTKNFNVLYIEDNLDVQFQTNKMLSSFFKKIELADNGKIALDLFNKECFDLIITDIKMPLLDGISLIETVRVKNKKIPIIVLSAHDDKEYFMKTINEGIDSYILKPYTLEQIAETLEKLLDKYDIKKKYDNKIKLKHSFVWDKTSNQLLKENEIIKLSKYERMLFELFITTKAVSKTYEEIEYSLFNNCEDNTKRLRNLMTRLKVKLNCDLFEAVYSFGYTLKYEDE
jgi:YesN/AraC family two-component response regulator